MVVERKYSPPVWEKVIDSVIVLWEGKIQSGSRENIS